MYVVYTEVQNFDNHTCQRWYYGIWADRNRANEVAIELDKVWEGNCLYAHCVCDEKDAKALGILNMYG